ncbi:hypothetical protein Anas_07999 [Armadillidium nasatum]|uniref:Uncharacterized protein n=1 Tax=Armadillidium nasatum TaxID=96803 RepID=A0A5N5SZY6_9CRUS|nr:hypothetical protein Anas_07999 [Armadillidium nasatum]
MDRRGIYLNKGIDWDWWLFNEGKRQDLNSVVPEVSRTGHAGSAGAHVTGFQYHRVRNTTNGWTMKLKYQPKFTGPFVLFLGVPARDDEYDAFYLMQSI